MFSDTLYPSWLIPWAYWKINGALTKRPNAPIPVPRKYIWFPVWFKRQFIAKKRVPESPLGVPRTIPSWAWAASLELQKMFPASQKYPDQTLWNHGNVFVENLQGIDPELFAANLKKAGFINVSVLLDANGKLNESEIRNGWIETLQAKGLFNLGSYGYVSIESSVENIKSWHDSIIDLGNVAFSFHTIFPDSTFSISESVNLSIENAIQEAENTISNFLQVFGITVRRAFCCPCKWEMPWHCWLDSGFAFLPFIAGGLGYYDTNIEEYPEDLIHPCLEIWPTVERPNLDEQIKDYSKIIAPEDISVVARGLSLLFPSLGGKNSESSIKITEAGAFWDELKTFKGRLFV